MAISPLRLEPYWAPLHYPFIVAWWKARGHDCLDRDLIPAHGVVVTRDKEPLAASLCYLVANARVAYIAFTVTSPSLAPRLAVEAVRMAIKGAVDYARRNECKLIWSSTDVLGLDPIYEGIGFLRTEPQRHYFMLADNQPSDMLGGEKKD